jgi:hypothetical protein
MLCYHLRTDLAHCSPDLHICTRPPATSGPATYRSRCMYFLGHSWTQLDSAPQGGWVKRGIKAHGPSQRKLSSRHGNMLPVLNGSFNLLKSLRGPVSRSIAVEIYALSTAVGSSAAGKSAPK